MVKIILVGIIVALVYSQPDLRLTVADWLKAASDFLIESVQVNLEILKLDVRSYVDRSKGIIQIRSAARLGQSDLGVNLRRVEYLFNQLEKF